MPQGAHVDSVDGLRLFKSALHKYVEAARAALGDAEGEMHRTLIWLEGEQLNHWQHQIRLLNEMVSRAKEAVRQKKLFKGPAGHTQSAAEEEKALAMLLRKLQEAEEKLVATRQYGRKLQKEILLYKGQAQRFATAIDSSIPTAIAQLDQMVGALESYLSLTAPEITLGAGEASSSSSAPPPGDSMAQGGQEMQSNPFVELRRKTPMASVLAAAAAGDASQIMWKCPHLNQSDQLAAADIPATRISPYPRSLVVLGTECWQSPRIYLERTEPAFEGQCGWYIGSVDDPTPEACLTIPVTELLDVRGDWRDLLTLPQGYLVMIEAGGIVAILDPKDQSAWSPLRRIDVAPAGQAETENPPPQ
jgi:hypothetical protein